MSNPSDAALLSIGFGNYIAGDKIVSILSPDSAPIKRMIADGRERGLLVDASFGRSTRSVILMNSNHMILSALTPEELAQKLKSEQENGGEGFVLPKKENSLFFPALPEPERAPSCSRPWKGGRICASPRPSPRAVRAAGK